VIPFVRSQLICSNMSQTAEDGIPSLPDDQYPCPHPNCNTRGFYTVGAGRTLELQIDTQNSVRSVDGATSPRRSLVGIFYTSQKSFFFAQICVQPVWCMPSKMVNGLRVTQPLKIMAGIVAWGLHRCRVSAAAAASLY
jgi:hypothetical protein